MAEMSLGMNPWHVQIQGNAVIRQLDDVVPL